MAKVINQDSGNGWTIYNGDCVEVTQGIPDNSLGFSVYSPPFAGLYIYSDSERDMGNCSSDDEFFDHYEFLMREIYRATIPGRLTAIHCKDLPAYFHSDGYAGLKDFPGEVIRRHERCGWKFHSRITIWKCPVTERERTNNNGLLHKTLLRDRSQLRQGMADYLIVMRKVEGDLNSAAPVTNDGGLLEYIGDSDADPREPDGFHPSKFARKKLASDDSINLWRRYAEPVWWDIDQQNVLNGKIARSDKDEKHICPLQLDVIARAVQLWTNPGDVVFSPFAGIGSEGHESIRLGRKFVGVELKPEYFDHACTHLKQAEASASEQDLFA